MTDQQLDEERIFHVARDIANPETREEYLQQVCAGDQALRERVEALLKIHEQEGEFLKSAPDPAPTAEHQPLAERPGARIGRYTLREQIGEGGMGTVFVAEQERPIRRKVAIKVVKPGMDSKAVVARFEAERQALAMMDHPNIAKVLDAGTTDSGRPYFVMELVHGIPITDYCDDRKLTVQERLKLFMQVCAAIQHAHQKAIIHRDIKPTNVLVTEQDGEPMSKVIDFGVAKALNQSLSDRTVYTSFQSFIGTPLYASPEQATLSNVDVDTRSDVYSLGVLLYELLTGSTPFDKEQFEHAAHEEICRIIREVEPVKPSTRISSLGRTASSVSQARGTAPEKLGHLVRGDLDWIVMKTLEKDRRRRYLTANSLAEDIQRYLTHEPVIARSPSLGYRLQKFGQRNKAVVTTIALLSTSLVLGILGTSWQAWRATQAVKDLRQASYTLGATYAFLGDADNLDKVYTIAEQTGYSDQLEGFQALIAYSDGDYDRAFQLCKIILERDPDDFIAQAILAKTSILTGQDDLYPEEFKKLRAPGDAYEELVYASVEMFHDPARAVERVKTQTKHLRSPLKLSVMTEALVHCAIVEGEAEYCEQALESMDEVEFLLDRNLHNQTYRLLALTYLMEASRRSGNDAAAAEKQQEAAMVEERLRAEYSGIINADFSRWFYLHLVPDETAAWKAIQTAGRQNGTWALFVAMDRLYSQRTAKEALADFDEAVDTSENAYAKMARLYLLSLDPDNRSDVDRGIAALRESDRLLIQVHRIYLTCLLGNRIAPQDSAKHLLQTPAGKSGFGILGTLDCLKYLAREQGYSETELLKLAARSRAKECVAHFAVAMRRFAERDRTAARESLEECVGTFAVSFFEYELARSILLRMKTDPDWPQCNWQ